MNQILVSNKVYVTPKLKRKKSYYKLQFVLSIIVVIVLLVIFVVTQHDQYKGERKSKDILETFDKVLPDTTVADDEIIVVSLNERAEEIPIEKETKILEEFNTVYKADNGEEYRIDSILNIPSLDIRYPVLSNTSNELLKISLNKFWGCEPNEIGNYCVVGHNYDGKDIFFGKLYKIQNGDSVEMTDKTGQTLIYTVYDKYIVEPTDVACTSQLTNNRKEATLITCSGGGKTRLVVKCRVIDE